MNHTCFTVILSRSFKSIVMTTDYRSSHLHPAKGELYHAAFTTNPYRNMVWQYEQEVLDSIRVNFYGDREIHHLDFACGTGRILAHFANHATMSIGVDLSPCMLQVARSHLTHSELIEVDLTKNDVLKDRTFNLITAFRFFPNAEPSLREEAMQMLVKHLDRDGYIIFNNHKHTGSTRNRLARLCGRRNFSGMSLSDVEELVVGHGMRIKNIYSLCIFPASEKHSLFPIYVVRQIDKYLIRCKVLRNYGENLIYVCQIDDGVS